MSSLAINLPFATNIQCTESELVVALSDGRTISAPLVWFPRLANASANQLANYELLGNGEGIHWPELDEDISVLGLFEGRKSVELNKHL